MKKTFIKILVNVLVVVVFIIGQYQIREYYGIDPRIWFFVVFGISFIGSISFIIRMDKMKEAFHQINVGNIMRVAISKGKVVVEKIYYNILYKLIILISLITSFTGVTYKLFFHEDFMARTTIYIIFLSMIVLTFIDRILASIVYSGKRRNKELIFAGMWVFIFLTNLIDLLKFSI